MIEWDGMAGRPYLVHCRLPADRLSGEHRGMDHSVQFQLAYMRHAKRGRFCLCVYRYENALNCCSLNTNE
jgi:hypothetical protein